MLTPYWNNIYDDLKYPSETEDIFHNTTNEKVIIEINGLLNGDKQNFMSLDTQMKVIILDRELCKKHIILI